MQAVDTNIIVRYLTGDDQQQAAKSRAVVDTGEVFASTTVILETEWVLRSVYGFSRLQTASALRAFLGLPSVSTDSPNLLAKAFGYADSGMDFDDALHLAAAGECDVMFTFDLRFIKQAAGAETKVVEP